MWKWGGLGNWADMADNDDEVASSSPGGSFGLSPNEIIQPPIGPSRRSPEETQYRRVGLNRSGPPTRDCDDYSGGRRPYRSFWNEPKRQWLNSSRADEVDNWGKTKKPISSNLGSGFPNSVPEPNWSKRDERSRKERGRVASETPIAPSPFGEARPREIVLAERGIDWKKLDLEIEAKRATNRPESREERIFKEETERLKEETEHLKEEKEHLKEETEHLKEETDHLKEETEGLKEEIQHLKKTLQDETTTVWREASGSHSSLRNTVLLDLETLRREICTQLLPYFWLLSCAVFLFVLIISMLQTFLVMKFDVA